jgi:hypothetical protein
MSCLRRSVTALAVLAGVAAQDVAAIVSDRHLKGVRAMACDLESASNAPAVTFTLNVFAKEHMLQLVGVGERFAYQETSDSTLRFRLAFAHGAPLDCDLELPAGALACTPDGGARRPRLGLCLPSE